MVLKKNMFARAAALALAAMVSLAGSGCSNPKILEKETVEIWCLEAEPFAQELSALADEYNASGRSEAYRLKTVMFASENELAEKLDESRPALLLCDRTIAESLNDRELLVSPVISANDFKFESFAVASDDFVGKSFFPVGASVQLLAYKDGLADETVEDFFSLCERASTIKNGFLGVDDYSAMINALLLSKGEKLGSEDDNLKSVLYVDIYNTVAGLAFDGGLYLGGEAPAKLVESGSMMAAYVYSDALSEIDLSKIRVCLSPCIDGEERCCIAKMRGLAYTNEDVSHGPITTDFIKWLFSEGRTVNAAVKACLLPCVDWKAGDDASELEKVLYQAKETCNIIERFDCGNYLTVSSEYEKYIRQALSIFEN